MKRYVSALRNSKGGAILVHITDLDKKDRNLDHFHELVDARLNDMIEDGCLFVLTYKKNWLPCLNDNYQFVAVVVSPSTLVVTVDFKTKTPLDNSIVDPSVTTIQHMLASSQTFGSIKPILRGIDIEDIDESRCIQAKSFQSSFSELLDVSRVSDFIQYIWENLKLKYYVTSFSKIDVGGSFYLGVDEVDVQYCTYSSKALLVKGFEYPESLHTGFREGLIGIVQSELLVLLKNERGIVFVEPQDLIAVDFHPVSGRDESYVLEVAVAAVEGIVFYDKEGPEAYQIDDRGSVCRIDKKDWYRRFRGLQVQ